MFIFFGKLIVTSSLQLGLSAIAGDNQILLATGNLCAKILGHVFFHKPQNVPNSNQSGPDINQSANADDTTDDLANKSYLEVQAQATYYQDEINRRNLELSQSAENVLNNTEAREQITDEILNSQIAQIPTMEGFVQFLTQTYENNDT